MTPPPLPTRSTPDDPRLAPALGLFAARTWCAFDFQLATWRAYLDGRSGLVHAPTGMGKTLAVWMGPLLEALADRGDTPGLPAPTAAGLDARRARAVRRDRSPPLSALWITPLRALAGDTHLALQDAARALGLPWSIELRTGDSSSTLRQRQRDRLPTALITTPESLALLLSYPGAAERFAHLRAVIVDEWHELLGTKRGTQTELNLATLRAIRPGLRTWGLSATLGNLPEALRALVGIASSQTPRDRADPHSDPVLIQGPPPAPIHSRTLIPPDIERFPWAGHLGLRLLPEVVRHVDQAKTSLVFTNTRSQTEIWFQSLLKARPDWLSPAEPSRDAGANAVPSTAAPAAPAAVVALHHGSLDRKVRQAVEDRLRAGELRAVVCTSSLDLGVDFPAVDQVVQVGSPKGVARLLQRAGRSGHQPGRTSRLICVPTNALELLEFAASHDAITGRQIEDRSPLRACADVLAQHLVTLAAGDGFDEDAAKRLVRSTLAFGTLPDDQWLRLWAWAMDFLARGGPALAAYPRHARVTRDQHGLFRVASPALSRIHRMGIGTITSATSMLVKTRRGRTLGSIEEGFINALLPGQTFIFSGKHLRLLGVRENAAIVEPAPGRSGRVPSWEGGRMPLSAQLAAAVRDRLAQAESGRFDGPEMQRLRPLIELQSRWSALPTPSRLVIERLSTREGHHAFIYPLEGRLVHEGLAALLAYRLARTTPRTFSLACSDYGLELTSAQPFEVTEAEWREALSPAELGPDLLACLNASQLARRHFRQIARVAGLLVPSYPSAPRSARQLQASSDLFFDVLTEFDPGSALLDQARREALERELEVARLQAALQRLSTLRLEIRTCPCLTPFAFPLWADSLRELVSTEKWTDRVARMLVKLEAAAGASPATVPSLADESERPDQPDATAAAVGAAPKHALAPAADPAGRDARSRRPPRRSYRW